MLKKLIAAVAYLLLFCVATALFAYFLFPLDRLREYVENKTNLSSKYRLEIGSVEREGLGRLVLTDISVGVNKKLIKRKTAPTPPPLSAPATPVPEDDEPAETAPGNGTPASQPPGSEDNARDDFTYIDIDSVVVDFDLMEMLDPSAISLGLNVELLGGFIENGRIELLQEGGKTRTAIYLPTIQDLQFGETEFFGALFSALLPSMRSDKVKGYLGDGAVELVPDSDDGASWYKGTIEIELGDIVAIEPILVQRMPKTTEAVEVPLTDMRLGKCTFKLRIDRKDQIDELDKVKTKYQAATAVLFEKGECKGESLDYYVKENSFILFPAKAGFSKGNMDFWTKLAFNPDYFEEERLDDEKQPVTKNKELGQGLEFDRTWQRAQDVDGFYWMHCKGKLSKPRCRRGLPEEEKRRKKALADMEKKQKKEAALKFKEAQKKEVEAAPPKLPGGTGTSPEELIDAAEKRREEARERAEARRKEREERRKEALDNRAPAQPSPPPEVGSPTEPGDEGEGVEEGTEEGYGDGEEGLEEEGFGEEEGDDEPVEGDEEPPADDGLVDDEAYPAEGELPPESPEPMGDEELPAEGEEAMVAPFP
jgi:hypothetical protein